MASKKDITNVTCGILYQPSFHLLDRWGAIVDRIISENKYFSADFFPEISNQYTIERQLINSKTGHSIKLTQNNFVYSQKISDNFDSEYKLFRERLLNFLIPLVVEESGLIIKRLGIVFTCFPLESDVKIFTSQYFKPEVKDVCDFRLSMKESTVEGALFVENSNYINKIITVGEMEKSTTGISYDYQLHYNPLMPDIRQCNASAFLTTGFEKFVKDVFERIEGSYVKKSK